MASSFHCHCQPPLLSSKYRICSHASTIALKHYALFISTLSWALFRLQTNQICFSNQIFKTDCPHCYFASDEMKFVCPDITSLFAWAAVVKKPAQEASSLSASRQFVSASVHGLLFSVLSSVTLSSSMDSVQPL